MIERVTYVPLVGKTTIDNTTVPGCRLHFRRLAVMDQLPILHVMRVRIHDAGGCEAKKKVTCLSTFRLMLESPHECAFTAKTSNRLCIDRLISE